MKKLKYTRMNAFALALIGGLAVSACRGGSAETSMNANGADLSAQLRGAKAGSVVTLSTGDTLSLSESTISYYNSRGNRALWTDDDKLTETGRAVFSALASSFQDGLDPSLYHYPQAEQIARSLESDGDSAASAGTAADLDIILTEGITRYASDLARGALDPTASGLEWRIPREVAPEVGVLQALAGGAEAGEILAGMRPKGSHYQRYMTALARYRDVREKGGWGTVPSDATAKPGSTSPAVAQLRNRLIKGADATEAKLAQTGAARPDYFDADLQKALAHFQDRHAIEPDGALGSQTIVELNHTVDERISEIAMNMDRWRWLPHDLGPRFILVNVAGFEMEVNQDGKVVEAMNVVVGQNNWKTPIFADTMEYMIVNPSWNVPESIMEDEIRPAMARNPNYLAENNMVLTEDGTAKQLPGDDNALGDFKFMFPNKDNIYLHDTPAKSLFSRTQRNFSHGCIRLERPADLARFMMENAAKRPPSDVDKLLASGEEQWVKFEDKWPVYILYFTAFVNDDGSIRFHHDVYGRDEKLDDQAEGKIS
ncbi:MAG TPA: L,D-transpeptidase family protein [Longimicrobiales bacterium]